MGSLNKMRAYDKIRAEKLWAWRAWLYRENKDVCPIAVCDDDTPVGFMLLDCKPSNAIAWHVYERLGFRPTGRPDQEDAAKLGWN